MKYTRIELSEYLKTGDGIVHFVKKDGTTRAMKCTLREEVTPPISVPSSSVVNEEVLAVWDLEKSAWRSFRIDSITNVDYLK